MHSTIGVKTSIGLSDIFPPQAILVGLQHRDQQGVIEELVGHLTRLECLTGADERAIVQSIQARENLGPTALGNGIAFPHCRSKLTERFVGVLGIDSRGISFNAVDGEPVHSVFLVLSPENSRELHFEVLGRFMAIGRDKSQRMQLRGCRTPEAAYQLLRELDRR